MTEVGTSLIGRVFGNYRLESLVASDGAGAVYAAVHPTLGKRVAVKVLPPETISAPDAMARLMEEARASAAVASENIVEVLDCGETEDGIPYLVSEMLVGQTLHDLLERCGRLEVPRAIGIARQICAALGAAHGHSIFHLRLNPRTVFLSQTPSGGERVKLSELGAAQRLDGARPGTPPTPVGSSSIAPSYLSPEQLQGDLVDGRCDVYALSVILFRAISGSLPFSEIESSLARESILSGRVPTMSERAPEARVSPSLEQIILRGMSRDPARRQPTIEDLDRELAQHLASRATEPGGAAPTTAMEPSTDRPGGGSPPPGMTRIPPTVRERAAEAGGLAASAVSSVEGKVSRSMFWFRLFLYPSLAGIFLLGYWILLRRSIARPEVSRELILVALAVVPLSYLLELGYHLAARHRRDARLLHFVLITFFILVGTYALQLNGTLTSYMVMFYAMVITFTRLRLDARAAFFASSLSIGSFLSVVALEHFGVIPYARMLKPTAASTLVTDGTYTVVITAGAVSFLVLAHLAGHILVRNLEAREEALASVSRGLEGEVAQKVAILQRRELLRRFLPPQLVESVIEGENTATVGFRRRKISVVVCALRDFCAHTARLEPEDQAKMLNEFYALVTRVTQRFDAVADSFHGATVTILLGTLRPVPERGHAENALRLGLGLARSLAEWLPGWHAVGVRAVSFAVAAHTGYAAVGNFGSEVRLQNTASGSALALAEAALAAGEPGVLVATHPTKVLGGEALAFEACGHVQAPGTTERVPLYTVRG